MSFLAVIVLIILQSKSYIIKTTVYSNHEEIHQYKMEPIIVIDSYQ